MKKGLVPGLVLTVLCLFGLSGCCDCDTWLGGILLVRLLNPPAAVHAVFFEVQPAGGGGTIASGAFATTDEDPEAYAMSDGEIHVFTTPMGDRYYLHVFVDETDDFAYSSGDTEIRIDGVGILGNDVQEVDYLDFTPVS